MKCPKCNTPNPMAELFTEEPRYVCRNPECRHEGDVDEFWTEADERLLASVLKAAADGQRDLCKVLNAALAEY